MYKSITPIYPYLPMIIGMAAKYDKKVNGYNYFYDPSILCFIFDFLDNYAYYLDVAELTTWTRSKCIYVNKILGAVGNDSPFVKYRKVEKMSYTKIICGKLYDGIHDELQENKEILIQDKCIVEVGEKVSTPEECKVVDLSNFTVTPGMIDNKFMQAFDWREIDKDKDII